MSAYSSQRLGAPHLVLFLALLAVSGCASNQTRTNGADNPDPLEPANRAFFTFNETLDKNLIKPISKGYAKVTPEPVRTTVTNFFNNLSYLNVILNSFLQGKFGQGVSDVARFLVNSTIGIGGLVDIATPIGLERHNEDLGQTFAVWGAGPGAYVYLPVRGPYTVRNVPDLASSTLLNPITYLTGAVLFPITALNVINSRANLLDETNIRDEAALDPYAFTREAYLQRRQYLIHDGNPPTDGYEEIFDEQSEDDSVLLIE